MTERFFFFFLFFFFGGGGGKKRSKFTRFLRVLTPAVGGPQLILRTGETGALALMLKLGESKIRLFFIRSHAMHTSGPANAAQIGLIKPRLF